MSKLADVRTTIESDQIYSSSPAASSFYRWNKSFIYKNICIKYLCILYVLEDTRDYEISNSTIIIELNSPSYRIFSRKVSFSK